MDIYDGKIHVYDHFYDYDEQRVLNSALVMDDQGNVIDNIYIIKDTDNQYYERYIPFHITDTLKLFWAYGSKYSDIENSYDIVKMNDDKEMEYVASLFPAGNQGAYFWPDKTLLLDNKLIVFGLYKLPGSNDSLTYYILAFDMDELIKGSTTVYTTDPIDIGDQVVVYPNPTMDKLYIKGVDDIINIDVFDNQGRGYPVNSGNYDVIDMESYPSGIYYIKIETTDSYKTLKVIKQ